MVASKAQLGIAGLEDPADLARQGDDQALVFEHVLAACREVARVITVEVCARELDRIWGDRGRPVSPSVLRSALGDQRGNYFRLEWLIWFAAQSQHVRDLLVEFATDTPKDPTEDLDDLHDVLREELGKTGEALIRKAKARRRRKR